jgi:lysozyme family protein
VPGRDLEDLTRPESEEILKEREWRFYGYQRLTRITIPAKIFDTHITFDFRPAIRFAQRALGVEETEDLDQKTIAEIENANSQDFFESYTSVLEDYVESDFGGDGALLRRVRAVPPRNVDSLDTFV